MSRGGARHRIRPILEKSVDELVGYSMRRPFASGMSEDIAVARRLPIRELSANQLRLLIQNGEAVGYLLPLALDDLERDPLVEALLFRGDLLEAVLRAEIHWLEHSELKTRVRVVVERALAALAEVRPIDCEAGGEPDFEKPSERDRSYLEPKLRAYLDGPRT